MSSSARKFDTASVRALLPESLQQQVAGIPNGNLEIFWNTQSYIRPNSEIAGSSPDLLYRPQYWLDPDAPLAAADYSKGFAPAISFWQTSTGVTINHNSGVFQDGSFSTHTGADNLIVSSEANCSIEAFITGNRGKSLAFWSLISYGGRNALTLHWLLSSEDNINLTGAIRGIKDMKELGKLIAAHPSLGRLYHFAF